MNMSTSIDRKVRANVQMARRRMMHAARLFDELAEYSAMMADCPDTTSDSRARAVSSMLVSSAVAGGIRGCADTLARAGAGECELQYYEMGAVMAANRICDSLGYGFQFANQHARMLLADANDRLNYAAVLAESGGAF